MGKTTENMVRVGDEVYVTNWSNYYQPETENNTVQVIIETREGSIVARSIYIASPNAGTGKSTVALGLVALI